VKRRKAADWAGAVLCIALWWVIVIGIFRRGYWWAACLMAIPVIVLSGSAVCCVFREWLAHSLMWLIVRICPKDFEETLDD
jgi:hypothetical protein